MFESFIQAFKTKDLRNKLLFTLFIITLFRLGSLIPTPGVNYANVESCLSTAQSNDLIGLINLFSGGALLQLSIFALGIMPYITSSIIVQLLRVVIPHFESLQKEGQTGQTKLTQYTRYITVALAILQSTTIIATARTGQLFGATAGVCTKVIPNQDVLTLIIMIICMTAGTSMIMWFGELVTEKGVGNGMSILIFSSICAKFFPGLWQIGAGNGGWVNFFIVVAILIGVVGIVVFMEQAQRRVPVQYPKRSLGGNQSTVNSSYLPMKINMSGVIPIIFSSSIIAVPGLISKFGDQSSAWVQWIQANLSSQTSPLYILIDEILIIAFCFFYVSITFNPVEQADNIKNYGGFVPGYRAGTQTANYFKYIINRLNTAGSIYLAIICVIPTILILTLGLSANLPFGGTTILIMVGVGLETVRQIDAQLVQHHYEGFMK